MFSSHYKLILLTSTTDSFAVLLLNFHFKTNVFSVKGSSLKDLSLWKWTKSDVYNESTICIQILNYHSLVVCRCIPTYFRRLNAKFHLRKFVYKNVNLFEMHEVNSRCHNKDYNWQVGKHFNICKHFIELTNWAVCMIIKSLNITFKIICE